MNKAEIREVVAEVCDLYANELREEAQIKQGSRFDPQACRLESVARRLRKKDEQAASPHQGCDDGTCGRCMDDALEVEDADEA